MNQPLVSVALCTYNGAEFVAEQIETILKQTYSNLEVIIVDDCSTDETAKIIQAFAEKDNRIQFFENTSNLGHNLNFDKACGLCTGELVAIADQDDVWVPEKIEIMVKRLLDNPENILVHCISSRFKGEGKPSKRSIKLVNYYTECNPGMFFLYNPVNGHNMLFKQELLKDALPFPEDVYYDWWLAVHAACSGNIDHEDSILVWHRVHETNASGAARPRNPFYLQTISNLAYFKAIDKMPAAYRKIADEMIALFGPLSQKKFSFPVFFYIFKHSKTFFAFKKRKFPFFSNVKHSFRAALASTRT